MQGPWSGSLQLWFPILALSPPLPWWPGGVCEHCGCWADWPSSTEAPPPRETAEVTLTKVVSRTLSPEFQPEQCPARHLFQSLFTAEGSGPPSDSLTPPVILLLGTEGLPGGKELKIVAVGGGGVIVVNTYSIQFHS